MPDFVLCLDRQLGKKWPADCSAVFMSDRRETEKCAPKLSKIFSQVKKASPLMHSGDLSPLRTDCFDAGANRFGI